MEFPAYIFPVSIVLTIFRQDFENLSKEFDTMGEGNVMFPTVPVSNVNLYFGMPDKLQGSSDRERLSAHTEVVLLQERLGISYKDASHRLYMAELERVKRDQKLYTSFASLEGSIKKTLEMAYNTISEIQGGVSEEEEEEDRELFI
jgi:hypothetical protein